MFAVTSDGGVLCFACLKSERRNILEAIRDNDSNGWKVEGFDINWEDPMLHCDNCSERFESAYAEDCVTGECDADCNLCHKSEDN